MRRQLPWVFMLMLGMTLAGCGQKGPLYREAASAPVATDTVDDDREAPSGNGTR